jgi:uncharacterized glyoxalase superfamily protein PhnB
MGKQPTMGPAVTPELGYGNARRAIQWLTEVLGLQHGLTIDGPDGSVAHAELWWHTGVVFVESLEPNKRGLQTGSGHGMSCCGVHRRSELRLRPS